MGEDWIVIVVMGIVYLAGFVGILLLAKLPRDGFKSWSDDDESKF
jgi:hypothetical protein